MSGEGLQDDNTASHCDLLERATGLPEKESCPAAAELWR